MTIVLFKDIFRELKKRFASLAIISLILTLGIGFFIGIKMTGQDMRTTGNEYYNEHLLYDSTITTSNQALKLINEVLGYDMNAIIDEFNAKNTDTKLVGIKTIDGLVHIGSGELSVKFIEYDEEDDMYSSSKDLSLIDGRFPDSDRKEVLIDQKMLSHSNIRLGDKIRLSDIEGIISDEYEIVGIVNSVLYVNFERGITNIGTGSLDYFFYLPSRYFNIGYPNIVRVYYGESGNYLSYDDAYKDFIRRKNSETKEEILSLLTSKFPMYENIINENLNTMMIFLTREDSVTGYSGFYTDAKRIEAIGNVFPLIFFLVAALVCFNSVSKLVDESRTQIGIYKALGYKKFAVSLKFIILPLFSYLTGVLLSVFIGFYFLPFIIYNMGYKLLYNIPELLLRFDFSYFWLPLLIGFICSVGIGFLKSISAVSQKAAILLRPKTPPKGKRILLERISFLWSKMSFLLKVSFRNLFRNKARFWMTVFGIGGCTGLIITGIGLYYSINTIATVQFDKIETYETRIMINPMSDPNNTINLVDEMNSGDIDEFKSVDTAIAYRMDNITYGGTSLKVIIESYGNLNEFYKFKSKDGSGVDYYTLNESDTGALISEKFALQHNIRKGDDLELNYNDEIVNITISGIVENYIYHYIYMSEGYYKKSIKDEDVIPNNIALNYKEDTKEIKESVSRKILELNRGNEFILGLIQVDVFKSEFTDIIGSFNYVVYVILVSAILLAVLVIVNLVSLNIMERNKELATLKVLGFKRKELTSYLLRENVFLTIISLLVGAIFGFFLHRYVTIQVEVDMAMFNRELNLLSVLFSILITIIVSVAVNLLMSRKIYKIEMSTALKSFN